MKISVIHPTIRPEQAHGRYLQWAKRACGADDVTWEYVMVIDRGATWPIDHRGGGYCVLNCDSDTGEGNALNFGASQSNGDVIIMASDDVLPPVGWDRLVAERIGDCSKASVLAVSDGLRKDTLLCILILTRKRFEDQGGVVYSPEYNGLMFADNEFTERAYRDQVVIEARDIVFLHEHPMFGTGADGSKADLAVREKNAPEKYARGREVFERRNAGAGWGRVAFGVRIGRMVDPSFFWSFTRLLTSPAFCKGDVYLPPAVEKPHAMGMNVMLWHFLKTDCDSLLCIDDDMEFQPQDVAALRATPGVDIVTPVMCCRRGGHAPLVLGPWDDVAGRPSSIPSKQFSGLVPVRYVGLGFTLIRRWVLEEMAVKATAAKLPVFGFDVTKGDDGKLSDDAVAVGAMMAVNSTVRVGHRLSAAVYWNTAGAFPEFAECDYGDSLIQEQNKGE